MKIKKRQLSRIIKEELQRITKNRSARISPRMEKQTAGDGQASTLNEGMTPDKMPESWHQILGNCLGEKISPQNEIKLSDQLRTKPNNLTKPPGPFEPTRPDEGEWGGYSPWLRTTLLELEKKIKNLGVDVDDPDDFNITVDEFRPGDDEDYPGGGGSFSVRWHLSSLDADDIPSPEENR